MLAQMPIFVGIHFYIKLTSINTQISRTEKRHPNGKSTFSGSDILRGRAIKWWKNMVFFEKKLKRLILFSAVFKFLSKLSYYCLHVCCMHVCVYVSWQETDIRLSSFNHSLPSSLSQRISLEPRVHQFGYSGFTWKDSPICGIIDRLSRPLSVYMEQFNICIQYNL